MKLEHGVTTTAIPKHITKHVAPEPERAHWSVIVLLLHVVVVVVVVTVMLTVVLLFVLFLVTTAATKVEVTKETVPVTKMIVLFFLLVEKVPEPPKTTATAKTPTERKVFKEIVEVERTVKV